MVYFVGAGSGAPDLITVRGKNLLEQADVIIYAGSLVNPELLSYKKEGCESQCRLCQRLACRWRQDQRLHGITLFLNPVKHAHHFVSTFYDPVHHVSPVWHPDVSQRLTADQAIGTNGTKISG